MLFISFPLTTGSLFKGTLIHFDIMHFFFFRILFTKSWSLITKYILQWLLNKVWYLNSLFQRRMARGRWTIKLWQWLLSQNTFLFVPFFKIEIEIDKCQMTLSQTSMSGTNNTSMVCLPRPQLPNWPMITWHVNWHWWSESVPWTGGKMLVLDVTVPDSCGVNGFLFYFLLGTNCFLLPSDPAEAKS